MEERRKHQKGRYIIYGAAVDVIERSSFELKLWVKRVLGRTAFRAGRVDWIDYRYHLSPHAYNRGDHAIVVAMDQRLKEIDKSSRIVAIQWGELGAANLTKYDKVLVCGSGYFFPNSNGELPQRISDDLRVIKKSGSELHFVGVGYNHLLAWRDSDGDSLSVDSRNLLVELLGCAGILTVRDSNTKKFLSKFTGKDIKVIGDPALFIDCSPDLDVVGAGRSRPRVGINIPFHGPQSTRWVKKNLHQFIGAIKRLQEFVDCEFTYFVHYDTELLISEIIRAHGIRIDLINVGAARLPSEYAKMDMHIGGMLHSCILASAACVPSIGLAYDEKHFGFFDLMGRSKYCLSSSPFSPERLVEVSRCLLEDVANERRKIDTRKQELFFSFEAVLREVAFSSRLYVPMRMESLDTK